MVLRWLRVPTLPRREALLAGAAAAAMALLAIAAAHKLGTAGLLAPLALVILAILVRKPVLTLTLVVGLTIFCEGPGFGLLSITSHLYTQVYKGLSVLDLLVALVLVAAFTDMLRHRRTVQVPRPLLIGLTTLALAMATGAVIGHNSGVSLRFSVFSEHVLVYLLLLPIAVANLGLDTRQIARLLRGATALAIVKAVLGLVEISQNLGTPIEGSAKLTYYEPTANWVIMMALLAILAALAARDRPPLWIALGSPLLIACLLLSYRRSFWIASVLGVLLVLLFATTPAGRRMLVPASLVIAAAIWLLGSLHFQSNLPVVKRITSLSVAKVETNREDRYRLDERTNVLSEIGRHPITGIGLGVPWQATAAPLSVEHEEGREYVHFAALWFWLKLGVLGLLAYVGVIVGSTIVAWQAWRRSRDPLLRAFAAASACGIAGLAVMDTTASFTGVEPRFTLVLAVQIGLLAVLARRAEPADSRELV